MRKRLLSVGSFPAVPIHRDPIADRILGPVRKYAPYDLGAIDEELTARHLSSAAVHAAAVAVLRPESPLRAPPQYQVFGLSRYRLAIISFNNDGMAGNYCGDQHTVIDIHGTSLSPGHRIRIGWEDHINALQNFPELQGLEIPGLVLPQRESETIAATPRYLAAKRLLMSARRVFLVGYSFGEMDDIVSYRMLTTAIQSRPMAVVVVNPDAKDLAIRVAEDSDSMSVRTLPVFWDKLASAILASVGRERYKTCDHRRLCDRCVAYFYGAFLDGDATRNVDLDSPRISEI